MKNRLFLLCMLAASVVVAEDRFPRDGWQEKPSPFASEDAEAGGELVVNGGPYPRSLNYLLDSSVSSADVFGSLFDTLLGMNPLTFEFEPGIAERWSVSDDKRVITVWLDPKATWSDGRPIVADDVLWTWQTILDPKNLTGPHKVDLERFEVPEVLGERQIRFVAKEAHWKNLLTVAGLNILPKHAMASLDFNKINFEFPVVSGPYRLAELKEGRFSRLERRSDWWQRGYPRNEGLNNFDSIRFMYFQERDNAFDAFKKGTVDFFAVYTAHQWATQTSGDRFDRNWVVKQKVQNYNPVGFQGFAMNMRRAPFDDVRVRKALALLLNREKMNHTLMYDQYFLHRSYFEDLYSPEHPCPNPTVPFDKEAARALLADAGWKANPATGLLEKDGKPLRFTFLTRDATTDRFLVIYKEDLKDVGIEIDLVQKDWSAWMKDMDEFNFDMTWAAWGGSIWRDPEYQWSSRQADQVAGQNITGFKNERVDELITQQRTEFNLERRNEILREIDGILVKEFPYILLWNINYTRLLYWNKFGMPATVLGKYGDERAAYGLWWYDADSADDLSGAMSEGRSLPRRPATVDFDEAFRL
ncbi:MAG: extracellular solute-binding protein [Kiritimatiellae bacterium]|nr:extracellular solute-binding protein [Kiritimatiellia bacterium]MCO5062217.1 extracellular solute-binding protein [Kiritimatiellia bacterium]MCO5069023.1 extracellular solute-binding protein [Kiritimatiellia bacterium]